VASESGIVVEGIVLSSSSRREEQRDSQFWGARRGSILALEARNGPVRISRLDRASRVRLGLSSEPARGAGFLKKWHCRPMLRP